MSAERNPGAGGFSLRAPETRLLDGRALVTGRLGDRPGDRLRARRARRRGGDQPRRQAGRRRRDGRADRCRRWTSRRGPDGCARRVRCRPRLRRRPRGVRRPRPPGQQRRDREAPPACRYAARGVAAGHRRQPHGRLPLLARGSPDDDRRRGPRAIVNITSVHEQIPWERFSHYCASKGGEKLFAQSIARELAPHGIRVVSVAPGAIDPINADVLADLKQRQAVVDEIPYGRWGEVSDVARAVLDRIGPG